MSAHLDKVRKGLGKREVYIVFPVAIFLTGALRPMLELLWYDSAWFGILGAGLAALVTAWEINRIQNRMDETAVKYSVALD